MSSPARRSSPRRSRRGVVPAGPGSGAGAGAGAGSGAGSGAASDGDEPMPSAAQSMEERRLANIRRNQAMLASLGITSLATDLRAAAAPTPKRKAVRQHPAARAAKTARAGPRRRSMRVKGLTPDGTKVEEGYKVVQLYQPPPPPQHIRPEGVLGMDKATPEDQDETEAVASLALLSKLDSWKAPTDVKSCDAFDFTSLKVKEHHVVKVVPNRVFSITMHPTTTKQLVFVGEKWGHIGMWSPQDVTDDDPGATVFRPHARPVSGLAHHPTTPSRLFSCSYDGSIRCLDVQKQVFTEQFVDEDELFSFLDISPLGDSVWVSARSGDVYRHDPREGLKATAYELHARKTTCVHVNPAQPHLLLTASLDQTAAIWDIRKLKKKTPKSISIIQHTLGVTGAFFSPDGTRAVTTGNDNLVKVTTVEAATSAAQPAAPAKKLAPIFRRVSAAAKKKKTPSKPKGKVRGKAKGKGKATAAGDLVVRHNNHTGRWLTNFKAVFHPRSSNRVFIGNMTRGIDVMDATTGAISTMRSENLTAVPTLNAPHPVLNVVASSTASGRLYLWS